MATDVFNEESLRAAVVGVWGEHGAHTDVLDHCIRQARRVAEMERVIGTGDSRALRVLLSDDPLAHALFALGERWGIQLKRET